MEIEDKSYLITFSKEQNNFGESEVEIQKDENAKLPPSVEAQI